MRDAGVVRTTTMVGVLGYGVEAGRVAYSSVANSPKQPDGGHTSWDVFVFGARAHAKSIDELPKDFTPAALGAATDVRQAVTRQPPGPRPLGSGMGRLAGPIWTIELNLDSDDPV